MDYRKSIKEVSNLGVGEQVQGNHLTFSDSYGDLRHHLAALSGGRFPWSTIRSRPWA